MFDNAICGASYLKMDSGYGILEIILKERNPFNMSIADSIFEKTTDVAGNIIYKTQSFDAVSLLVLAMRTPGATISRSQYLRKELSSKFPDIVVETAIQRNPAYAGIDRATIDEISRNAINYETTKVSAASFAAGLQGGVALAGAAVVDITQYFVFLLRVMQKLAYLYGFDEFNLKEEEIDDETLNIMLGVMFGAQGANVAINAISKNVAARIAKTLPRKALTKGVLYPIVKKIAKQLGFRMTKQIFADGLSKIVPVLGGAVSGVVTYASFKPCSLRLKKKFRELPTCDPNYFIVEGQNNTKI